MPVSYTSTRGHAPDLPFDEVLLTGLARDGGLYVPITWPQFGPDDLRAMAGMRYADLAVAVTWPFVEGTIHRDAYARLVADAYAGFGHRAVAPLVQLDQGLWLMELFHGPTIAFKDYPLQVLGRLFDQTLAARGKRITVVGATSGDTGSAAIEACRDRDNVDIVILYPHGRVSEVQRRQMTTVPSGNVHCLAIEGSFDDCQDLVKAMFNDAAFRDRMGLSAVNSINWARIMAQIVYYAAASLALGAPGRPVAFSVPTGNFGNVYAAYAARQMGFPIERLIVGANRNDILDRFFKTGEMRTEPVVPTLSPSMDIQISSNLERLLFDLCERDGPGLAERMAAFRRTGTFATRQGEIETAWRLFCSHRLDDDGIRATIRETYARTGQLLDPHTAVGVAAAEAYGAELDMPVVALACAHPAKFPDAVEAACGLRPGLPARLGDLYDRPERATVMANDLAAVQAFVADHSRAPQSTYTQEGVA